MALPLPRRAAVRVAGAEISYAVHGDGGRDLVLVHGSNAHTGWWHAVLPLLTEDWRVITLDLSGHGDSGHRAHYAGALWAEELLAVLDAVRSERPVVAAHSLGGRVALLATRVEPERFAALVLLDTGIWPPERLRERLARLTTPRPPREPRVYPTYEEARARFQVRPPQPQPPAEVLDPVAAYGLRQVPGGWSFKQDPGGFPPLYSDAVPEAAAAVRVPVTVVSGELSDVVTPEIVERAAAIMPTATFVRLPGVHHHLTLEAPAACARIIDDVGRACRSGDVARHPSDLGEAEVTSSRASSFTASPKSAAE